MPEKIHMIAICGTGMGTLAGLLKAKGYLVTGSDANVYPPMSDQLSALGIKIYEGYQPENITAAQPDWVIVGNAISKNNEEVLAAQAQGLKLVSMPEAISKVFLENHSSIVVAGTHGKTTTSSLMAWLLERTGQSPSFLVGGILKNFGRSYQLGSGDYFVIEGDEYDSAFFDKGPKFLHYRPKILILNSVEFDHADIYRDLDHVLEAFAKLIALLPPNGLIVADGDSANVRKLLATAPCRVLTFGFESQPHITASQVSFGEKTSFHLQLNQEDRGAFESPLAGHHNLKNLMAVIAVLLELGITAPAINQALGEFEGVKRRQEVLATIRGITLIDDFAHHPTAVMETLKALRGKYGQRRLWAIFEPRSNTTRRKVFQKDFVSAFDVADEVIFSSPYLPEKIPEADRLDPEVLVHDLNERLTLQGKRARYVSSIDSIVEIVIRESKPGDVVCFMSNGGFGGIYAKMLTSLAE